MSRSRDYIGSVPVETAERLRERREEESSMDESERRAHAIIDTVETAIRKAHPFIDRFASTLEGRTLLHGEAYYTLEGEIAEMLRGAEGNK